MKEQFTPGPWVPQIEKSNSYFADMKIVCKDLETIAVIQDNWSIWNSDGNKSQAKREMDLGIANAHIIAAAPDMYEALKKAKETIELLAGELNYQSPRWVSEHL